MITFEQVGRFNFYKLNFNNYYKLESPTLIVKIWRPNFYNRKLKDVNASASTTILQQSFFAIYP